MTSLETQVAELKLSLDAAASDIETKGAAVQELTEAKAQAETELAVLKQSVQDLTSEQGNNQNVFATVKAEVSLPLCTLFGKAS